MPAGNNDSGGGQDAGVTSCDTMQALLIELHDTSMLSWRKIAELPDFAPLPPGTLCRWANTGYLPPKWYGRFGFDLIIPMPACPVHGVVHCYDCASQIVKPAHRPPGKPRPPRISISLDDPDSAARSILAHMEAEAVAELVRLLEDRK